MQVRKGWSGEVNGAWLKLSVEVGTDDCPEIHKLDDVADRVRYLGFQATRALTVLQHQNGVVDDRTAAAYDQALQDAIGAMIGPFDT